MEVDVFSLMLYCLFFLVLSLWSIRGRGKFLKQRGKVTGFIVDLFTERARYGLVTSGPYAYSRNPQYIGFILFVIGMTLYWPTLITIPMAFILCFAYYRLGISEEKNIANTFDAQYQEYSRKVPRFLGKDALKIFRLPKKLSVTEYLVVAALLIPFVLWLAEALAGMVMGAAILRAYWFPIAYLLPIHIGVIISLVLLVSVGTAELVKSLTKKRKRVKDQQRTIR
jgi:hypothetical protein